MSEKNKHSNPPADPEKTPNPEVRSEKKQPSASSVPQRLSSDRSTNANVNPSHDKEKTPSDASKRKAAQKNTEARSNGKTTGEKSNALSQSPTTREKTGSAAKRGNELALLALIVGAVAITIAGYTYNQFHKSQQAVEKTGARAQRAENQIEALNEKVADLQSTIATTRQGFDESAVKRMITAAVSGIAEKPIPDEAKIKAVIARELDEREPAYRLTDKQVQTMIDEALLDYERNGGTAKVHAAQIETLPQREDAVKNAHSALDAHAERLKQTLSVQAQALDSKLRQTAETPDPTVLTATLTLAAIASENGDYRSAARYLAQTLSTYDSDHLNQAPYLVFKAQIAKAKNTLEMLAGQNDRADVLAALGAEVENWPFRAVNVKNETSGTAKNKRNSLTGRIEQAGRDILSKAFSVNKNDTTGLTWINANQYLQSIVRESVRLDLAYARNLAMLHDDEAISGTVTALKKRISRYFDSQNDTVKATLTQLDRIAQPLNSAPDIAALAKAVRKAIEE